MEQLEPEILDSLETPYVVKRNTFITVLCILTWVGCGVMLIYYAILFAVFQLGQDISRGMEVTGTVSSTVRWYIIYYTVAALCVIPCLVGSILMWRMKVSGFVFYVIGEGIPVLFGFFVAFNGGQLGLGSIFTNIFSAIIPVGFIVMYGLNLKYMRVQKDDGFN